jgi:hypothetical protein
MSLPPSITTAAVSWGALMDWAGEGATVSVTTEMVLGGSLKSISHVPSGTTILPFASTVTASAGASATWAVPHVDQDGFIDGSGAAFKNWAYRSTAKVTLNKRTTTLVKEYQVLVGQNALDLDLVPDGSIGAPSSAPLPLVLSVNGQTGNVIVEGGTGGGVDDAGMRDPRRPQHSRQRARHGHQRGHHDRQQRPRGRQRGLHDRRDGPDDRAGR